MEPVLPTTAPGFLARLRPVTPWRLGPDSGVRDQVDPILHSDTLFSAVSSAMAQLGMLDEWLAATALAAETSAVRLSSGYPFQGELLYIVPPRSLWPPPASAKVRWKGARFVPVSVVSALLADQGLDEERWMVDGWSECLIPARGPIGRGPFRPALRSAAALDRRLRAARR